MILSNPWGLLGLTAIPVILYLHFYRSHRREIRVGGLHLWRFAQVRVPMGRKWQRLQKSLSLLCQILAAILLSLLLAGIDLPKTSTRRHYVVILDDSVSMQAGEERSAAVRAGEWLANWMTPGNQYTLIKAGLQPSILAQPYSSRVAIVNALEKWTPESSSCNLESALNMAGRFFLEGRRVLFVTDHDETTDEQKLLMEVASFGRPEANACVEHAERSRISLSRERLSICLKAHTSGTLNTRVKILASSKVLYEKEHLLSGGKTQLLEFKFDLIHETLEIQIEDSSFKTDNMAFLPPLPVRPVSVWLDPAIGAPAEFFSRAVESIPDAGITKSPEEANLVFTKAEAFDPLRPGQAICHLPPHFPDDQTGVAVDSEIGMSNQIGRNLSAEGVIWPHLRIQGVGETLVFSYRDNASLFWRSEERDSTYYLNLDTERTNMFKRTMWPLLMEWLIEKARAGLPGMRRSSFRAGEPVHIGGVEDSRSGSEYLLTRNGLPVGEYDYLPDILEGLSHGQYEIQEQGSKARVSEFAVNLFSTDESKLQTHSLKMPNLLNIQPESRGETQKNMPLYLVLLFATFLSMGGAWIFQDSYR